MLKHRLIIDKTLPININNPAIIRSFYYFHLYKRPAIYETIIAAKALRNEIISDESFEPIFGTMACDTRPTPKTRNIIFNILP